MSCDEKRIQTFVAVEYLTSVTQMNNEDKEVGNRTSKFIYEWIFKNFQGCVDREKCVNYTPCCWKKLDYAHKLFF